MYSTIKNWQATLGNSAACCNFAVKHSRRRQSFTHNETTTVASSHPKRTGYLSTAVGIDSNWQERSSLEPFPFTFFPFANFSRPVGSPVRPRFDSGDSSPPKSPAESPPPQRPGRRMVPWSSRLTTENLTLKWRCCTKVGGWGFQPNRKRLEFVNWDDDIPNYYGKIIHVPATTNQKAY